MKKTTTLVIAIALGGCGPTLTLDPDSSDDGGTTAGALGDSASTGAGPTTAPPPPPPVGDDSTGPAMSTTSGGDDGGGFIPVTDAEGGQHIECDIYTQDCEPGYKCMPWANDGGSSWNATRCSPIADNPGAPGDPCTVEGSGVSGIDDCQLSAMCWDVDPKTNMGTCLAMCTGAPSEPVCEDPGTTCAISGDGVLVLCIPICDPLQQDCDEGQGCYPINSGFQCAPVATESGEYADACEFLNACAPGLFCLAAATVPECPGPAGCCTPVCDLESDLGDDQCPGVAEGQQCLPWFADDPPPGYDNVGACALTDR